VVLQKNLEKELMNVHELLAILRRQGRAQSGGYSGSRVLESNGSVSLIKKSEMTT